MKRTTLFEFSVTRPPQSKPSHLSSTITFEEENTTSSHFLSRLTETDFVTTKEQILEAKETFREILDEAQIRAQYEQLLTLSEVIHHERFSESFEELEVHINTQSISTLMPIEKANLLDNLIHSLYSIETNVVNQLIQDVLRANAFLNTYRSDMADAESFQLLKRAKNSLIVLPIKITKDYSENKPVAPVIDQEMKVLMKDAHETLVARSMIKQFDQARKEWKTALKTIQEGRSENLSTSEKISVLEVQRNLSKTGYSLLKDVLNEHNSEDARRIENDIVELKDRFSSKSESPLKKSEQQTLFVEGHLLEEYYEIPESTLMVQPVQISEGLYDFYLSYYCSDAKERILNITGTAEQDNGERIGISNPSDQVSEMEFQLFKLNDAPLTTSVATFNLSINTANPDRDPEPLDPFTTFESIPHVDRPGIDFDGEIDNTIYLPPPPFYGVNRIGILDFYRVEQELSCYTLAEVSHIESILARQYKERASRDLTRVSREFEQEFSTEATFKSDTQTTTRNEMQTEVSDSLQRQMSQTIDFSTSFGYEASPFKFNIGTDLSFNKSRTSNHSEKQAFSFAREVTEKTEQSISQKKRQRNKSSFTHEFEENNKHGFDNREGNEHVVGIYWWLDKIYNNYLVNYGRRMVYEFCIPEPALNWRRVVKEQTKAEAFELKLPKSLKDLNIHDYRGIKERNYAEIAQYYGVEIEAPPQRVIYLNRSYSHTVESIPMDSDSDTEPDLQIAMSFESIEIPPGYRAHAARKTSHVRAFDTSQDFELHIMIGTEYYDHWNQGVGEPIGKYQADKFQNFDSHLDISIPVSCASIGLTDFTFHVIVKCIRKQSVIRDWKLRAYTKLKQAYDKKMASYNEKLAEYEEKATTGDLKLNPRFQNNLMKIELKKACILMMTEPFDIRIHYNHYHANQKNRTYELKLNEKLDKHSHLVKFLEQAFDWELMTAIFYPYFYGPKRKWKKRMFSQGSGKQNFKAFLNAGMSRVELPVRPGFEAAVTFFFQTGEVFGGKNIVTASDDNLYVSVADELTEAEPVQVERTWQSKIPTSLTVLQSNAAALNIDGLPCEIADNRLASGNSQLGPVIPDSDTTPSS